MRPAFGRAAAAGLALGVVVTIAMRLLHSDRHPYIQAAIIGMGFVAVGAITVFLHPSRRRSGDDDR